MPFTALLTQLCYCMAQFAHGDCARPGCSHVQGDPICKELRARGIAHKVRVRY
jgi:hypothetical protein